MNFILKPSLEHMALVKIAISLWNQSDVRALIVKHNFSFYSLYTHETWKTIEESVTQKVPQLLLPELLKKKVFGVIKPIGMQIFEWMKFHYPHFDLLNLPVKLYWTPQGTIDRQKTAEVLVRDESLDMATRYKLACFSCLEDYINLFWNIMPQDLKASVHFLYPKFMFWSHSMGRREGYIDSRLEFFYCVSSGNKVAANYFLQKLTPREREESLVEASKSVGDADTLYFLISEMNEKQQIQCFRHKPYKALQCFLQWPRQSFFIGLANCMWDYLSKWDYEAVLRDIHHKVKDNCNDWDYQKLFQDFWQKSPNALKCFITNEIDKSWLLSSLFDIKDKETIKLILKDVSPEIKKKLIYSDRMNTFCQLYILKNEWDFLEFCIRECLPSKNEMLKFKEEYDWIMRGALFKRCRRDKQIMHSCSQEDFSTYKHKWDEMFRLCDDSIIKHNKRTLEGESSSSK